MQAGAPGFVEFIISSDDKEKLIVGEQELGQKLFETQKNNPDVPTEARPATFSVWQCYHFESLSTTIREFKTLKAVQFSRLGPLIL